MSEDTRNHLPRTPRDSELAVGTPWYSTRYGPVGNASQEKGLSSEAGGNDENVGLNHPLRTPRRKEKGVEVWKDEVRSRYVKGFLAHPRPGANKKKSINKQTAT